MLLVDDAGKCVDANRAAGDLFRMPREQLLGREPATFCGDTFDLASAWEALRAGQHTKDSQRWLSTKPGAPRLHFSATSNIAPGVHLWVLREVSAPEFTGEPFRQLLESAPDAMIILGVDGRIAIANSQAEARFGWSRHELAGQTLERLIPERFRTVHANHYGAFVLDPRPRPMAQGLELRALRKDGTEFPVEISLSPFRLGEDTFIIAAIRDVTMRKEGEQALRRAEDQLRQAQKMEAIGCLAGGVAHDFNNLLSVILGYASMILESLSPGDPLRADVDELLVAGHRATDLTRQLLAFSRNQVLEPRVVDLKQELASLQKLLRRLLSEDIELSVMTPESAGKVFVDVGQFEQVVMNLVVNARDAMPRGGNLTIEAANIELDSAYAADHAGVTPGPYVMLAVTDTGVGMTAEIQSRIFDPFFTTKESGKGTGLGLATVFGIVKQSGGHICVYSEPGHGTTFKIYLPRTDRPTEPLAPTANVPVSVRGSETILLVEDEDQLRSLTKTILARHGYGVLEAHNGDEALTICRTHTAKIDLIVTDVIMPRMTGPELRQQLSGIRPETKVLFMSGYPDNSIVHHGVLERGIMFLAKPVTPDALLRKVREVLNEPNAADEGHPSS
jgi:two-component system cell cycle sensor histidine kinase/response regulator CckA